MASPLRECSVRWMSSEDIGWVAGLLEGEGSFLAVQRSDRRTPRLRVAMQSTDLDVLVRLQQTTGVGSVSEIAQRPGRKQCWQWQVGRHNDCLALMRDLYYLMGDRRQEQIRAAVKDVGVSLFRSFT